MTSIHDRDQVRDFATLVMDGEHTRELVIKYTDGSTMNARVKNPEEVVSIASAQEPGSYVAMWIRPNPLSLDSVELGKVCKAESGLPNRSATANDVVSLKYFQVDCDVDGIKSRDRFHSYAYTMYGMEPVAVINTGNGASLLYLLDVPNTKENSQVIKNACLQLAADAGITIDSTFDAPRLIGIPGTINAKPGKEPKLRTGQFDPDVPYVPFETLQQLADMRPKAQVSTSARPSVEREMTSEERESLVNIIKPYWQDGVRHNFGVAVSGLLYHMGVPIQQASEVIGELSADDNDPTDRMVALEDTYKRGAAGDPVAWHDVLSSAMPAGQVDAIGELRESIRRRTAPTLINIPTQQVSETGSAPYSDEQFAIREGVHCQYVQTKSKDSESEHAEGYWKPLTNFTCWVQCNYMHPENSDLDYAEVVMTDVHDVMHGPVAIPLSKFRRPDEWISLFGTWPRIYPRVHRDVILNAIQSASGDAPVVVTYARLGWVKRNAEWSYLTPSGALTANHLDTGVRVEPGGRLNEIQAQWIEDEAALAEAVRAVLRTPAAISNNARGKHAAIAVLSAALRAPLIPARRVGFILQIVGETGAGKSAIAGLAASLYSPKFKYDHHIGGWYSTENAILSLASRATHVFMNMDEYHETGATPLEAKATASKHANIVYAVANDNGRDRLNRDGTPNDAPEIATMMASTQEHDSTSTSASGRGRTVTVQLEKRGKEGADLNLDALIQIDREYARTGVFNMALSGYLRSLASQLDELRERSDEVHDQIAAKVRKSLDGATVHERTVPNIADLAIGWNAFLAYAFQVGAVTDLELKEHQSDLVEAFTSLAKTQAHEQEIERPERVIIELLQEAFDSRVASLRWKDTDSHPEDPTTMGWRESRRSDQGPDYQPARNEIGWVDHENVYLLPRATAAVIQQMARATQVTVPAGERQLGLTLQRAGIALEGNEGRPTRKIGVGAITGIRTLKRCIVIPRNEIFETDNVAVFPRLADEPVGVETGEIA